MSEELKKCADSISGITEKLKLLREQRSALSTNPKKNNVVLRVFFPKSRESDMRLDGGGNYNTSRSADMMALALCKHWDAMIAEAEAALTAEHAKLTKLAEVR